VSDTEKQRPKFRPNPKRQLILVVLALIGLGVGYGLGFVFKRPPPAPLPEVPAPATNVPAPAPQSAVEPAPPATTPPQPESLEKPGNPAASVEQAALPPAATPPATGTTQQPTATKQPDAAATPTPAPPSADPSAAWRKFAVAVTPDGRPKIAIVMDDLGIDRGRTRRTMDLPGPLTLSFLAYARELQAQADAGRGKGHEIWLHVPMEPGSATIDPGPNVLLTGVPAAERAHALQWNLDQLKGFVGINNHMGSRFTSNLDGMRGVMAELKKRGLAFLDSVTSAMSVGHVAAREAGVPFMLRNVFLDHEDDRKAVEAQLHKLEVLAKKHGEAVAIGHPREATLAALTPWLATLDKKGFQLVPASALLRVPQNLIAEKSGN